MKVLQIEFNELSPQLLTQFMAAGELPNFRRLHDTSHVFTTDARAEPPNLEPWIQWPTVHLGVSHLQHGLRHLGGAPQADSSPQESMRLPGVAQLASDAGLRVGVFGAMNIPYRELSGFYVPDPWNAAAVASPDSLQPFMRTVGAMVRDSSRTEGTTPGAGLPAFVAFLLRHGLTPRTVSVVLRQLLDERRDAGLRWRRASVLDWIQYDIFRYYARRERVDFATFFSNSTAHYQHYFWRHMDPAAFETPPEQSDHASYADAVRYGYRSMDRIIGRMLADYPRTVLVFCTALSQQPWTSATKQTYRPRDWAAILRLVGLSERDVDVRPVMAEEFLMRFPTEAEAIRSYEAYGRLAVEGVPLMQFTREGNALIGGCAITHTGIADGRITGTGDGSEPRMDEVFTPIHTVRSGRHKSEGALWIRTGDHRIHPDPVDLEDIAPTVLELVGVPPAPHMTGAPLPIGQSALRR
ncbi:hypothetical protein [Geodermatophilus marinus]|uniref:hypothetical protein n=1 Tax=Geodermatophilus sp. LHW52908 TaxID=2303986 RepID=UPI000E3E2EC6|nr:hypothetical protein [Geodermatophilus sp. LHW52908]RFU22401.1 hypothetical protein D0Z06_07145 [Geodermatophilus sp. LHW52908]